MQKKVRNFYEKIMSSFFNSENKFYECCKQIGIYNKHDVQRANFINAETDFINAEKKIQIL